MTGRDQKEWNMILELQSPDCNYERTQEIFGYFYETYHRLIASYVISFFSGAVPDYYDILQESYLSFFDYLKYRITKLPVMNGFYSWIRGTLTQYTAHKNQLSLYDNIIINRYKKLYDRYDLSGNEDSSELYSLYVEHYGEKMGAQKALSRIKNYVIFQGYKSRVVPVVFFTDEMLEQYTCSAITFPYEDVDFSLELRILKSAINDSNSAYKEFFDFLFQFKEAVLLNGIKISWSDDMYGNTSILRKYMVKSRRDLSKILYNAHLIDRNLLDLAENYIKYFYFKKYGLAMRQTTIKTFEKKTYEQNKIHSTAKISSNIISAILNDYKYNNLTMDEISRKYFISLTTILRYINLYIGKKEKKQYSKRNISSDVIKMLIDDYNNTHATIKNLSEKYHVSSSTITKYLKPYSKTTESKKIKMDMAEEYMQSNMAISEIAQKYHIDYQKAYRWLKPYKELKK